MVQRMMKTIFPAFAFCSALSLMLLPAQCLADEYEIEIAPKVINLQCGGNDFSIHTNIPCGTIDGEVCLSIEDAECEGDCCTVCTDRAQCDNRGNFVGKFEVEDVVSGLCLEAGSYRLVMSGEMSGVDFTAAQECEMECDDEEGDDNCEIECEALKVIDNPKSCSNDEEEEYDEASEENGEKKKTERVQSRLGELIQCMQQCVQE